MADTRRPRIGTVGVLAVLLRPALWITALRQTFRLAPTGWWRRVPFLPLPDARFLQFRWETQYGNAMHRPAAHDLVAYLTWCRSYQRNLHRKRSRV